MVLNRITLLYTAICAVIVKCYGHDIFVNDTTICDTTDVSLFQNNWFVIRGEMSRAWNGAMRLAVTDSLKRAMTETGKNYQTRHTTVIDTFIANHGRPRLEKYYRLSGFYNMLDNYAMIDLPLTQLVPIWLPSTTGMIYTDTQARAFCRINN